MNKKKVNKERKLQKRLLRENLRERVCHGNEAKKIVFFLFMRKGV
jgi:hypothetical protein